MNSASHPLPGRPAGHKASGYYMGLAGRAGMSLARRTSAVGKLTTMEHPRLTGRTRSLQDLSFPIQRRLSVGRGDRRKSPKMRRHKRQRKLKLRQKRKQEAAKSAKTALSGAKTGESSSGE